MRKILVPILFLISNEFFDPAKPNLYSENNRVKKIRITSSEPQFVKEYEIADTPNPQFLILPERTMEATIEITGVYPGTKYNDTAINVLRHDSRYLSFQ